MVRETLVITVLMETPGGDIPVITVLMETPDGEVTPMITVLMGTPPDGGGTHR